MTNINTTLMQNVFNIAQTQRKTDVVPNRKFDNFGGDFKIFEGILFTHFCKLNQTNRKFKVLLTRPYNAMENENNGDAVFRFPDKNLTKEIKRMVKFISELDQIDQTSSIQNFSLNNEPFFLKFCPRVQFDPYSHGITKGMCIPLSYWKCLETDESMSGPQGGKRLTYANAERYFNNTEFADMVKNAWIGTTVSQSQLLEIWMKGVLETGRSLTFAVKKETSYEDE